MTDRPMKLIVDLSKPEGEREQLVPMTDEEIARQAEAIKKAEAEQAAQQAEAKAKEDARQSAIAKLAALGLTEEEANALLG